MILVSSIPTSPSDHVSVLLTNPMLTKTHKDREIFEEMQPMEDVKVPMSYEESVNKERTIK